MSDLSVTLEALERSRSQLSVSTYFDADVFRRENEQIFQNGPRYLGHELAVPEVGDYRTLIQEGEGRALVRTSRGVELISNVCRHRQAVMLRGSGNTQNMVPLRRCCGAEPDERPSADATRLLEEQRGSCAASASRIAPLREHHSACRP